MSVKDVKNYYKMIESQYLEMLSNVKDFDECLKNGQVTQEQVDQAKEMLSQIKDNYERMSYVMWLFVQPKTKLFKKHFNKNNKSLDKHFSNSAINSTNLELSNKKILDNFKKLLDEVK